MPYLRLNPSASITSTEAGLILRSDLGIFQMTGSGLTAFVEQVVPLLDGSRDRDALVKALCDYSQSSVTSLLDLLEARRLVEVVPAPVDSAVLDRWRGQAEFFREWSKVPEEAMRQISEARILVAGLEPWGCTAAIELAAAGIGAIHLVDDVASGPLDMAMVRGREETRRSRWRREAVAAEVRDRAPRCRVEQRSMSELDADDFIAASRPWHLLVAAVAPEDTMQVERVARFAHRTKAVSLWSHLTGTTAVIGPLVMPGHTACRICATAEELNPSRAGSSATASAARIRAMQHVVGQLVAMEGLKLISGYKFSELGGRFMMQDLSTFESSLRTLVRLPWCRVCGDE